MKKKTTYDLLLLGGILLASALLYLVFRPGSTGAWAVVTIDGAQAARYPLAQDITVTLGDADYNTLQIANGAASITDANCGDHTCVRTGEIRREGETIVCLPHRLTVSIEGGAPTDLDGVSQ